MSSKFLEAYERHTLNMERFREYERLFFEAQAASEARRRQRALDAEEATLP